MEGVLRTIFMHKEVGIT